VLFFFSSRRRHTRSTRDWSSDVCSSDLVRSSQLDALVEGGNLRASFAKYVRAHLDAYLSATQLGVTLASLALGYLGEQYLAEMRSEERRVGKGWRCGLWENKYSE